MRRTLHWLGIVLALLVVFAGVLYALAEWDEVVILHSRAESGELQATHLWVVDDAGALWLRSSGRERGWFVRAAARPEVELERAGAKRAYTATVVDTPEAAARVTQRMREKYGWIDALIEFVEGGWTPVAVRLDPR
ncbi:MAG: nitroreductase/quinone reductase family protein [Myxococcota bacterium]